MKKWYMPLILILTILIVLAIYLLSMFFWSTDGDGLEQPLINEFVGIDREELTEEEQIEVLNELAPENPVDTDDERQQQIDLLRQLQNR